MKTQSSAEFYVTKWNLKNLKFLKNTPTSDIYTCDRDESSWVLKVLSPEGIKDEADGAIALKLWNGNGAASLAEADSHAMLIEHLDEPNLYSYSEKGNEKQATQIFVDIIRKIHKSSPTKNPGLKDLKWRFKAFESKELVEKHHLLKSAKVIAEQLISSQKTEVLLHGDLHHENVMRRKNGDFVCFDPKGLWGDPCYEISTILMNPWDFPEISENEHRCLERARDLAEQLALPLDRVLKYAFVHACLSILWNMQDQSNTTHQLRIATFLERCLAPLPVQAR